MGSAISAVATWGRHVWAVLTRADERSRPVYVVYATAAAAIPANLLALVLAAAATALGYPLEAFAIPETYTWGNLAADVFLVLLFAPIVETGLMALFIFIIRAFSSRAVWLIGITALVFGLSHSLLGDTLIKQIGHALPTMWAFAVYAGVYLAWTRGEHDVTMGYTMATLTHACYNLVPVGVRLIGSNMVG
jgi:hypothetical protein